MGRERLRCERLGGVGAAVVGDIPAQLRRHGFRHDQDSHPHRLGHTLDGRQTRIALAALNLRQMLRRHADLGRQVLQRQTTLIALAAQEGGDQSFHGGSVAQWWANYSYDRVNSYGGAIFFAMPSVLGGGVTHSGAVWGRRQVRMCGAWKSGQSPESVLTDPQQCSGVERVGSKPVASAPKTRRCTQRSPPAIRSPQQPSLSG